MRSLVIGIFIAALGAAHAEDYKSLGHIGSTSGQIGAFKCDDKPFAELPAMADRLGVAPGVSENSGASMILQMCDGRQYDFFKIINAVLDRMDKASR
jgi:hypothetical protein